MEVMGGGSETDKRPLQRRLFIRPAWKLYLHILCIFHRGGFNKISVSIPSFLLSFITASRHHQRHYSLEEFQRGRWRGCRQRGLKHCRSSIL